MLAPAGISLYQLSNKFLCNCRFQCFSTILGSLWTVKPYFDWMLSEPCSQDPQSHSGLYYKLKYLCFKSNDKDEPIFRSLSKASIRKPPETIKMDNLIIARSAPVLPSPRSSAVISLESPLVNQSDYSPLIGNTRKTKVIPPRSVAIHRPSDGQLSSSTIPNRTATVKIERELDGDASSQPNIAIREYKREIPGRLHSIKAPTSVEIIRENPRILHPNRDSYNPLQLQNSSSVSTRALSLDQSSVQMHKLRKVEFIMTSQVIFTPKRERSELLFEDWVEYGKTAIFMRCWAQIAGASMFITIFSSMPTHTKYSWDLWNQCPFLTILRNGLDHINLFGHVLQRF